MHVIVEYQFETPVTNEELKRYRDEMAPCLRIRQVRWIRSTFSKDRRRGFCVLEAPDVESVRESYRLAGVAFRSMWAADTYEAPPGDNAA